MNNWSIKELKRNARRVIFAERKYFKILLFSVIISIFSVSMMSSSSDGNNNEKVPTKRVYSAASSIVKNRTPSILSSTSISSIFFIVTISIRILLLNPIIAGGKKYILDATENTEGTIKDGFFWPFRSGKLLNIAKIMIFKDIYVILWSLLLIVPGIIKLYSYRMIPYILSENPNIEKQRAFQISTLMTDGQKFSMLVLDFSFLGWIFLALVISPIATSLVFPYQEATEAELYKKLKESALQKGLFNEYNLNI